MLGGAGVFEGPQSSLVTQEIRRSLTRVLLACLSTGEKDVSVLVWRITDILYTNVLL